MGVFIYGRFCLLLFVLNVVVVEGYLKQLAREETRGV